MSTPTLRERVVAPEPPVAAAPAEAAPAPQSRIRIRRASSEGIWAISVSLAGAMGLVWVLHQRVLPLTGAAGLWILVYLTFLGLYVLIGLSQWPIRTVSDRLVTVVFATAALAVMLAVLAQIVFVIDRGSKAISHGNFWTQTMARTGPLDLLTSGGMVHALVGSLEQLGIATIIAVPIGIVGALYLVEMDDWLVRPVRVIVEAMTALPEIIAGLFVYVTVVISLGAGFSGFAAALALAVMMVPIVTRTAEVVLRLVPGPLREASYALGASQFRTVWNVVLPTARSGLSTAVILAMARAVGETSPVLLTAGFTNSLNADPFHGPQASLPLYIYNLVRTPQPTMISRAFGAGLALMIMVLVLFVLARMVGGRPPGELSKGQRRRLDRDTARNLVGGTPA